MSRRNYNGISFDTCTGVYEPADDSFLLIESSECRGLILDMGTGAGLAAINLAKGGFSVVAVDISDLSVECAQKNAALNGVDIQIIKSDLFSKTAGTFDTVLFNPPYLPVQDNIPGSGAWDGGKDGFAVIRRFLMSCRSHLNEGGHIFIILSDLTDIQQLQTEFKMFSFEIAGLRKFDFETIYCYRLVLR